MDRFVARQNIEHLRETLGTEIDPVRRKMIGRLLAEQDEELKAANKRHEAQQGRKQSDG